MNEECGSMPQHLGTVHMVYRHFFYAFRGRPPFEMVGSGPLHALPEPHHHTAHRSSPTGSTVQFASGLMLNSASDELVISYSSLDCGAYVTRVPVDDVLRDLGLGRAVPEST